MRCLLSVVVLVIQFPAFGNFVPPTDDPVVDRPHFDSLARPAAPDKFTGAVRDFQKKAAISVHNSIFRDQQNLALNYTLALELGKLYPGWTAGQLAVAVNHYQGIFIANRDFDLSKGFDQSALLKQLIEGSKKLGTGDPLSKVDGIRLLTASVTQIVGFVDYMYKLRPAERTRIAALLREENIPLGSALNSMLAGRGLGVSEWDTPEKRKERVLQIYSEKDPRIQRAFLNSLKSINQNVGADDDYSDWETQNQHAVDSLRIKAIDEATRMTAKDQKEIIDSQKEAIVYIKSVVKEIQEKEENLENNHAKHRAAELAVQTAAFFFPNNREVQASAAVAVTAINIHEIISAYKMSKQALDLVGMVNIWSKVLNLGNILMSIFGGKSADQMILEQLQELRKQVEDTRVDLSNKIEGVNRRIDSVRSDILTKLDVMRDFLAGDLKDIKAMIRHLGTQNSRMEELLHKISDENHTLFREKRNADLGTKFLEHSYTLKDPVPPVDPFGKFPPVIALRALLGTQTHQSLQFDSSILATFRAHMHGIRNSVDGLSDETFVGPGFSELIAGNSEKVNEYLSRQLSLDAPSNKLQMIHQAFNQVINLGVPGKFLVVPEAENFKGLAVASSLYSFLLFRNQELAKQSFGIYKDYSHEDVLREFLAANEKNRRFREDLAPIDADSRPTIWHILPLLRNYNSELTNFSELLKQDQQKALSVDKNGDEFGLKLKLTKSISSYSEIEMKTLAPVSAMQLGLDGRQIPPCTDYQLPGERISLPISEDLLEKFKEAIPKEFRALRHLHNGSFEICFRDIRVENEYKELSWFDDHKAIKAARMGNLSVEIECSYKGSELTDGQKLPIFRRRIIDSQPIVWWFERWVPIYGVGTAWFNQTNVSEPRAVTRNFAAANKVRNLDQFKDILFPREERSTVRGRFLGWFYQTKLEDQGTADEAPMRHLRVAWDRQKGEGAWGNNLFLIKQYYERLNQKAQSEAKEIATKYCEEFRARRLKTYYFGEDGVFQRMSKDRDVLSDGLRRIDGAARLLRAALWLRFGDALTSDEPLTLYVDKVPDGNQFLNALISDFKKQNPEDLGPLLEGLKEKISQEELNLLQYILSLPSNTLANSHHLEAEKSIERINTVLPYARTVDFAIGRTQTAELPVVVSSAVERQLHDPLTGELSNLNRQELKQINDIFIAAIFAESGKLSSLESLEALRDFFRAEYEGMKSTDHKRKPQLSIQNKIMVRLFEREDVPELSGSEVVTIIRAIQNHRANPSIMERFSSNERYTDSAIDALITQFVKSHKEQSNQDKSTNYIIAINQAIDRLLQDFGVFSLEEAIKLARVGKTGPLKEIEAKEQLHRYFEGDPDPTASAVVTYRLIEKMLTLKLGGQVLSDSDIAKSIAAIGRESKWQEFVKGVTKEGANQPASLRIVKSSKGKKSNKMNSGLHETVGKLDSKLENLVNLFEALCNIDERKLAPDVQLEVLRGIMQMTDPSRSSGLNQKGEEYLKIYRMFDRPIVRDTSKELYDWNKEYNKLIGFLIANYDKNELTVNELAQIAADQKVYEEKENFPALLALKQSLVDRIPKLSTWNNFRNPTDLVNEAAGNNGSKNNSKSKYFRPKIAPFLPVD